MNHALKCLHEMAGHGKKSTKLKWFEHKKQMMPINLHISKQNAPMLLPRIN
jgi:hypothetical protein